MEKRNLLEGVVTWGVFYLGMFIGGLLMVIVMGVFLEIRGRSR
jgi:hypothetical protein